MVKTRFGSNQFDSEKKYTKHKIRLQRKVEKMSMLRAILEAYESLPYEEQPHHYLVGLRDRFRNTSNQLKNMVGFDDAAV